MGSLRPAPSGDTVSCQYDPTTGRLTSVTYTQAGGTTSTINYTSYDDDVRVIALNENRAGAITPAALMICRVTAWTASASSGSQQIQRTPLGDRCKRQSVGISPLEC